MSFSVRADTEVHTCTCDNPSLPLGFTLPVQLLPSRGASGKDGVRSVGKTDAISLRKKAVDNWYFSQKAGQRSCEPAASASHSPQASRKSPEVAQVVVWVCLLYFAFGI